MKKSNQLIVFNYKKNWLHSRLGNIEVKLFSDHTSWHFNWLKYEGKLIKNVVEDAYDSCNDCKIIDPNNLEEVRQIILKAHKQLSHNGYHHKDLKIIMNNTWILENKSFNKLGPLIKSLHSTLI